MMTTLKESLDHFRADFRERVPGEALAQMDQSQAKLEAQNLEGQVIKTGEILPNFELPDATGKIVQSNDLLKQGPLVINFYRGGWCPYCNLELRALQNILPDIQREGAQLVAISPQIPDESLSTQEKNELAFPVLSDVGNAFAKQLGLVFKLDDQLLMVYKSFGIHLEQSNGTKDNELPLPATLIVDRHGKVQLIFAKLDYTQRLEPSTILESLQSLITAV